jgi:hypothetical protein
MSQYKFQTVDENTLRLSGYTMPIKDILKRNKARYEPATRSWLIPDEARAQLFSEINSFEDKQRKERELKWTKACKNFGYDFVRKGSPEYEKVLAFYKSF